MSASSSIRHRCFLCNQRWSRDVELTEYYKVTWKALVFGFVMSARQHERPWRSAFVGLAIKCRPYTWRNRGKDPYSIYQTDKTIYNCCERHIQSTRTHSFCKCIVPCLCWLFLSGNIGWEPVRTTGLQIRWNVLANPWQKYVSRTSCWWLFSFIGSGTNVNQGRCSWGIDIWYHKWRRYGAAVTIIANGVRRSESGQQW